MHLLLSSLSIFSTKIATLILLPMQIDGAYSTNFEQLCPKTLRRCVKISCECVKNDTRINAIDRGIEAVGMLPCNMPRSNTIQTLPDGMLPRSCPIEIPRMVDAGKADIFPGKFEENPLPVTCSKWQEMTLFPDPSYYLAMYHMGRKDAIIWAKIQQLIP